ncbi:hypothetical protein [Halomonas cupida]|uniref:hypothetical protein n=1 Tax=Halomonas cupida TaxID=44933 RepID=UPI003A8D1C27
MCFSQRTLQLIFVGRRSPTCPLSGINPACFHVGLIAAQGCAAVDHQADARPHHTSRSAHLCQWGADENQIDQDELFDCHVNNGGTGMCRRRPSGRRETAPHQQIRASAPVWCGRKSNRSG